MLHAANNRPSRTCVIKEYQYYTISLSKYQKRSRKVKNGQYGQKWSIRSKPDKNRSKKVKNGQKH